MSSAPRTAITKIELHELVLTHGLPLVLAKKLALFLTVLTILITVTSFLSAVLVLVNVPADLVGFGTMSPASVFFTLLGAGLVITIIPGLLTYLTLPKLYDRDLAIARSLPVGDGDTAGVREINAKLAALDRELHGWKDRGLIRKHGDVYVSEKISSNVVTYGNLDRARVVFALDVLKAMSYPQLRAILAHETGHIVENDYVVLCLFAEVTKILHFLYLPFKLLSKIVGLLFSILARLQLGLLRYVFSGMSFLGRFIVHLVSLPLWLPRALLYWESQLAEYLADDFGIALGGSASGLITALMKLENMRLDAGKSGFKRRYDLFATVVSHGRAMETNSALGDLMQFLGELESSHPQSVRRWRRMAHIGFQDERIT